MSDAYRAIPADDLRIAELDGLTLIYHRPSGQTHVVASPLPEILAALGPEARTPQQLLEALARRHDVTCDATAEADLRRHLVDLVALGLIHGG